MQRLRLLSLRPQPVPAHHRNRPQHPSIQPHRRVPHHLHHPKPRPRRRELPGYRPRPPAAARPARRNPAPGRQSRTAASPCLGTAWSPPAPAHRRSCPHRASSARHDHARRQQATRAQVVAQRLQSTPRPSGRRASRPAPPSQSNWSCLRSPATATAPAAAGTSPPHPARPARDRSPSSGNSIR